MPTERFIFYIVLAWVVIALLTALLLNYISNGKLSIVRYFVICLFFSFLLAILFGIVDLLAQNIDARATRMPKSKGDTNQSISDKPVELKGDQYYIDKGSKRIKVYETELASYLDDGWTLVNKI